MNRDHLRKIWAFLNQPLFVRKPSQKELAKQIQHLERCWSPVAYLERCWAKNSDRPGSK